MKDKVRAVIKTKADSFNLSFDNDIGRYFMENDGPWEYLWAKAENEMHRINEESRKKSLESKVGHASRVKKIDTKPWEKGASYLRHDDKYRAKISLLKEIEQKNNKEIVKAEELVSAVLNDLYQSSIDEHHILSDDIQKEMRVAKSVIQSVSSFVKSVSGALSESTTRVLTGVTAVLAPQPDPSTSHQVSQREFTSTFGLSRKAKYFKSGVVNRELHNKLIALPDDVAVGDLVTCRGCPGTLVSKNADGSCTVKLSPWGTVVTYPTKSAAKLRRMAPVVDEFTREKRSDSTSDHIKNLTTRFF